MKYMGGKYRIKKEVSTLLNEKRDEGQWYVEQLIEGFNDKIRDIIEESEENN